jgi:hypothetical protein
MLKGTDELVMEAEVRHRRDGWQETEQLGGTGMSKLTLLLMVVLIGVAGVGASTLSISAETARDLHLEYANPDGTVNCTKWCGVLEPCC